MRHKTIDVPSSAPLALPILRETVLEDGATWATARGPADAEDRCALLQGLLDQAPGPHPAYAPMPQCAAAAILLHAMDPMAWRRLVGNALPGGEHEAGTLAGLLTLQHLPQLVADDHDLSLDPRVPHPALVRQDALPFHAPTVTPKSLLDAIGPIVAHVPTP